MSFAAQPSSKHFTGRYDKTLGSTCGTCSDQHPSPCKNLWPHLAQRGWVVFSVRSGALRSKPQGVHPKPICQRVLYCQGMEDEAWGNTHKDDLEQVKPQLRPAIPLIIQLGTGFHSDTRPLQDARQLIG